MTDKFSVLHDQNTKFWHVVDQHGCRYGSHREQGEAVAQQQHLLKHPPRADIRTGLCRRA